MRVLHVIAALDVNAGGPPRVAAQLSSAIAALGHEATVVCMGRARRDGGEVDPKTLPPAFSWVPGIGRVRIFQLAGDTGIAGVTLSRSREELERIVRSHDVVHLHGVWDPILLHAATIAREAGVPYVVRPAGMLDPWSLRQRWLKKRLALALGYRKMLECAAFIHALNRDEKAMVGRLGLGTPIEVIPNGTFQQWIDDAPMAGMFREQHPAIGDRPYVLFLSRLHHKKGLDYLADAFKLVSERVPEARLVVAGPDEGAQRPFEERVAALGLRDRVILTGPLYTAEKMSAIIDATCFCLPSRQEGFSVAVIESLSMGTPVVISEACHFPEVDGAEAGVTVALRPEAIAAAIERVITDPALRAHQSRNAVRLIEEHYTWPRIAEACVAAYGRRGVRGSSPRRLMAAAF